MRICVMLGNRGSILYCLFLRPAQIFHYMLKYSKYFIFFITPRAIDPPCDAQIEQLSPLHQGNDRTSQPSPNRIEMELYLKSSQKKNCPVRLHPPNFA
jgi:hypothetical protein